MTAHRDWYQWHRRTAGRCRSLRPEYRQNSDTATEPGIGTAAPMTIMITAAAGNRAPGGTRSRGGPAAAPSLSTARLPYNTQASRPGGLQQT